MRHIAAAFDQLCTIMNMHTYMRLYICSGGEDEDEKEEKKPLEDRDQQAAAAGTIHRI